MNATLMSLAALRRELRIGASWISRLRADLAQAFEREASHEPDMWGPERLIRRQRDAVSLDEHVQTPVGMPGRDERIRIRLSEYRRHIN